MKVMSCCTLEEPRAKRYRDMVSPPQKRMASKRDVLRRRSNLADILMSAYLIVMLKREVLLFKRWEVPIRRTEYSKQSAVMAWKGEQNKSMT